MKVSLWLIRDLFLIIIIILFFLSAINKYYFLLLLFFVNYKCYQIKINCHNFYPVCGQKLFGLICLRILNVIKFILINNVIGHFILCKKYNYFYKISFCLLNKMCYHLCLERFSLHCY